MMHRSPPRKQTGAALVIGLILMVVVTVLAISGMNTATTELAMARNDQYYENAFQAAETGLEEALSRGSYDTLSPVTFTSTLNDGRETVQTTVQFQNTTVPPDDAYSLGSGSGLAAYHFVATARAVTQPSGAATDRDASAQHTQGFYVMGPASPTL